MWCAVAYSASHLLDFIDGRVARAYNQCSHFGVLLDHTLDIFTTVFMALSLASEQAQLLNFLLFDSASYVIVVMLLINRAIQTGRLRDKPLDYTSTLSDGIIGKWNVPWCVSNGTFLNTGHFLFMFHQIWLAMLYVDYNSFAPVLSLSPQQGYPQLASSTLLVAYYTMVAVICYECLVTYSEPSPKPKPRTVITFGTYDLFHYGHLRVLERAAQRGDRLVVGVSSDKLNWDKKQNIPAINQTQRMAIVESLGIVDEVFVEEKLELKKEYCIKYGADVLVMGDDHWNEYDEMLKGVCECEYVSRTQDISSTMIKRHISDSDFTSSPSSGSDGAKTSSDEENN
jgi:glycerol-3-phosphate cytidylyltransferase